MSRRDPRSGRYVATPLPPPAPDPLVFPTRNAPRLRLRVFDQCWPWRRSLDEVIDDAVASGNAGVDPLTRRPFIVVPAMVQRDPPGGRTAFVDCTPAGAARRAQMRRGG